MRVAVVALAMAIASSAQASVGVWTLYRACPTRNSHVHGTNKSTGATGNDLGVYPGEDIRIDVTETIPTSCS